MELSEIQSFLYDELARHSPTLRAKGSLPGPVEFGGTIPAMQGKQKVQGHYFASVVAKPKDIRLYFLPIYSHPDEFSYLSEECRKALKGKSCFHIKKVSDELRSEFSKMISKGIFLYQRDGLI